MSAAQWSVLGLLAVLVFWMVGAYNRLVLLRSAIGAAVQQIDELVQRRAAAADALAARARAALASEQTALDAWLAAQTAARQAALALRQRPVMSDLAAALAGAEAPLSAATTRVLSLLDQQPALLADTTVAAHVAALREVEARLGFARQVFNESAQIYNEDVRIFPTRVLAKLVGFGTAGRL